MCSIKSPRCSRTRDYLLAFRNKRVLLPIGALLLIYSVGPSFAQVDPKQLIDRNPSRPQTVSRNELLAPGNALRATKRAYKEIVEGHLESAQSEITHALNIAPQYGEANAVQGAIYLESKNYDAAAQSFQEAINDDPVLGAAYMGMAAVLMRQNHFHEALPLLDRAEGLLPASWFVHFAKAWTDMEIGNAQDSLKQADLAERFAASNSAVRSGVSYLRAMVFININDLDTARAQLAEAVARDRSGEYAALAKNELQRLQPLLAAGRWSIRTPPFENSRGK